MDQDGEGQQLEAMQRQANKRSREFEKAAAKAVPGSEGFVDYSRRAFFKEFIKVRSQWRCLWLLLALAEAKHRRAAPTATVASWFAAGRVLQWCHHLVQETLLESPMSLLPARLLRPAMS
jgi:hypothetical protein